MVLEFFRGRDESGLDHVERQIVTMLADCRHSFDAAMHALITGDPSSLADDIAATDRRINATEQAVRRELVVHASVHGGQDVPLVLAYMMITRMLERVGDQAKNILDLAAEGASFAGAVDREQMIALRDEISAMFPTTAEVFTGRDDERAREVLRRCDELLRHFDELVAEQIRSDEPGRHAVPRALLYRYMKRITANLANVMSSVVLPVDRMDYYGRELDDQGD